jgi:Leucine-rich repeat (LRR) protein
MHSKALLKLNGLFGAFLLSACSYSVSVNDNVVYMPPSLFSDYRISDTHLAACVEQSIIDQQATSAKALKRLSCSNAGIQSLMGLEVFAGLEEVNLAQNVIKTIDEIAQLPQLRVLMLSENPLQSAAPLLSLLHLRSLNLDKTPLTTCTDVEQLEQNWADLEAVLIKPAQCR